MPIKNINKAKKSVFNTYVEKHQSANHLDNGFPNLLGKWYITLIMYIYALMRKYCAKMNNHNGRANRQLRDCLVQTPFLDEATEFLRD